MVKKEGEWVFDKFGPFIDKTIDQVFVCTGIHYIDLSNSESIASEDEVPSYGDYLIAVSIRGADTESLNLTACGHKKIHNNEEPVVTDREGWYTRNNFKSINFKITQALDVFSHEV